MTSIPRCSSSVLSTAALLALLATVLVGPAWGQSRSAPLAPAPSRLAAASATEPAPPARVALAAAAPLARLVEAQRGAVDQVDALAAWNRAGRLPLRVGIVRPLPLPAAVRFGEEIARAPAGVHAGGAFARVGADATAWGASVRVEEAHRLRLVLEEVTLPAGTRLWVYGQDGETVAFGPELAHEGTLWTPSVAGPEIHLEVELDRAALSSGAGPGFSVAQVAELFRLDAEGAPLLGGALGPKAHDGCLLDLSCVDASTFPVADQASRAIARIEFPVQGAVGVCTGGLLNLAIGAPDELAPPFLTANHCFSEQFPASQLEAFWDFRSSSCDGSAPADQELPRTNGSTLLATSFESDFTLVEIAPLPDDRVLLGWDASSPTLTEGTILHRISHPFPHFGDPRSQPQRYTRYRFKAEQDQNFCEVGASDPQVNDPEKFHHTVFLDGGTFGGSSGAPLMTGEGQVVGQLFGACGLEPEDGCSKENDELDGNFFTTFGFVAPFLGLPQEGEWLSTPELPGFEFQVQITPAGGPPVTGEQTSECIPETFCVEGALPGRPEAFVKMIGPRPNGFLWVQISRFTPSQLDVFVRQESTGEVNQYTLPAVGPGSDDVSGLQDRQAFSP